MQKRGLKYLFIILILVDLGYSFLQHYNKPLDGDMPGGIVPAEDVKQVLGDPFGWAVIANDEYYPNPNRFFSHWAFQNYFIVAPELMQAFSSPVDSVYLSAAGIKTVIQISLIILLGIFISGRSSILSPDFLLCALLVTPLFQTNGWQSSMGIIDSSITYTFFYALPMVFLLVFFFPFHRRIFLKKRPANEHFVFFSGILLSVLIAFSSPLIPGIILIVSSLYFLKFCLSTNENWRNGNFHIRSIISGNKKWIFLFVFMNLLSLYSLYIGTNNSIFYGYDLPLSERYMRLPQGLFQLLTQKIGWMILIGFILLNVCLIKRKIRKQASKFMDFYKWIFIFSILYLLLLPLGGYKDYRPLIIRYDTFMPVTLGLFFIFGSSTFLLLKGWNGSGKAIYFSTVVSVLFLFSINDRPEFDKNDCERNALTSISNSRESSIELPCSCTIISWGKIENPENSKLIGRLLLQWNITEELKTFSQP